MQLPKSGMVLINKPVGPTSHDIVARVRRLTGIKRIGHAGTLDPFASGLLIILIGREWTRRQAEFLNLSKTYETTIMFGATSNTDDITGIITPSLNPKEVQLEDIKICLDSHCKTYAQMPPSFSAKKIKGKKAYELAREGIQPDLKPKEITIHSLELLLYTWPRLSFRTTVSSGTYIRALARDIGNHLSCGAYCETLSRTAIGDYTLADALTLETPNRPT